MKNRIKERRNELGIKQCRLAKLAGVSRATMSRYENEKIDKIPLVHSIAIAAALRCSPEELFDDVALNSKPSMEGELLRLFATLTDDKQEAVLTIVRAMT